MRVTLLIALTFFSGLLSAQESNTEKLRLSLEESIKLALENNEQVQIAELEKGISKAQVGEIRSQGLPQVNISSAVNYNFEPQKSLLDPATFGGGGDSTQQSGGQDVEIVDGDLVISFQQTYDANLGIGISQLIFDGSYFVGLQAARTYQELAQKQKIKTEIDIIESVSKAYYLVLINKERLKLIEANIQRVDTLLRETDAMYQNGFVEKIDVSRVRVNHNNLKVQLNNVSKLTLISEKLLKFQMGLPLDQSVELTDDLESIELNKDFENLITAFDYESRIEFSQILTNQSLAKLDMKNNKSQYLPKIYAGFNYGWNTATSDGSRLFNTERWLSSGLLGATITIPVFDGLRKSYKIQQNKIQYEQLELQKDFLKKSIDIEIEQNLNDLQNGIASLEVQEQNVELAREIFDISRIKYEEGIGSNFELTTADTDLKTAQTNYYNALYDAIISKIELQKALGILK